MAFINKIYRYKKIFRDIEKATKKCVHLNGAIEFNKTCLTNGIYIYIYISIYIYIDYMKFIQIDYMKIVSA